jgi:hypothetical protein
MNKRLKKTAFTEIKAAPIPIKKIVISLLIFLSTVVNAQENIGIKTDTLGTKSGNFKVVGYPIAFYTPETDAAAGVGAMTYFNLSKLEILQTSKIKLSTWYSRNNQYLISIKPAIFFPGTKRLYLEGELKFAKEKSKFYGIGNSSPVSNEQIYSINRTKYYVEIVGKGLLFSTLRSGFVIELSLDNISDFPQYNPPLTGIEGGKNTGVGLVFLLDKRNNIFYPTKDGYYKFLINFYGRVLGGIFTYDNFLIDLRQYHSFFNEHVIAFQLYANFTDGNPPFYNLPALGGSNRMRGYFEGRYRDRQYITAQVEYRKIIWWRLGIAAFYAIGDVAPYIGDFRLQEFKHAYGVGLRFLFDKKQKINLRMDMGFGSNTRGVYFSLEEAF